MLRVNQYDILYDPILGRAMRISGPEALDLAALLLRQRGVPPAHADLQAAVLVGAERKGHPSHGLQRLPRLLLRIERGLIDPVTEGAFVWRAAAFLAGDGENGLGPVVGEKAIGLLADRIAETGIAVAAVRNANHLGMLAHYVERIAEHGCIGLALSSSEALVHPHGGTRALIGTNPVAVAVPVAGAPPFVVDLATSVVSMGKVHHYAATGAALEPGWAKDGDGRPTTDATRAKAGAIAPFGGAKGYALGLAFELVVAALADSVLAPDVAGTLDAERPCNKGDVFIMIDAGRSPGIAQRLSSYLDVLRASEPETAGAPVSVPGDGARRRAARADRDGFEIAPALLATLHDLARPGVPA
jgi:LDH2 family malate/lactate/ureidoglycolate dehydrogenase